MIEIALDGHENNIFLDKERPVFNITASIDSSFENYRRKAIELLELYRNEPIVLVKNEAKDFSLNKFALALFIESCHQENRVDCAVFKVKDVAAATAAYKPYVALTIAVKYAMRLCGEDVAGICKDIEGLGYLGLQIERDYLNDKILMTLPGEGELVELKAKNIEEALIVASSLKALSLVHRGANVRAEIKMSLTDAFPNEEVVIKGIIQTTGRWID